MPWQVDILGTFTETSKALFEKKKKRGQVAVMSVIDTLWSIHAELLSVPTPGPRRAADSRTDGARRYPHVLLPPAGPRQDLSHGLPVPGRPTPSAPPGPQPAKRDTPSPAHSEPRRQQTRQLLSCSGGDHIGPRHLREQVLTVCAK